MACSTQVLTTPALATAWSGRIGGSLKKHWQAYWTRRGQRATVFMLHALDDHTLHDLGVDRSEIESVVHNPGGDRRRRYESVWE